ncbi:hypothetical protein BB560_000123 [Smittium megazygosporum]|uniref:Uncharacterized protein n=1 Tax=Smittium megazygosporum TaxID=133381 RepID=A0A2T9ZLC6_9FUNG|nr:hypothetical protein BB560_000123 [Smittium megazygosporum]
MCLYVELCSAEILHGDNTGVHEYEVEVGISGFIGFDDEFNSIFLAVVSNTEYGIENGRNL